jgi:hypothetical protein
MNHTRACFDEQKTAYCGLVDGVPVAEGDIKLLFGIPDDAFNSSVPSVGRFDFVSIIHNQSCSFFSKMNITNFLHPIFHLVLV